MVRIYEGFYRVLYLHNLCGVFVFTILMALNTHVPRGNITHISHMESALNKCVCPCEVCAVHRFSKEAQSLDLLQCFATGRMQILLLTKHTSLPELLYNCGCIQFCVTYVTTCKRRNMCIEPTCKAASTIMLECIHSFVILHS